MLPRTLATRFTKHHFVRLTALACAVVVIAAGCDGGLAPPPVPPVTTLAGTIRYVGGRTGWPRRDSVFNIRLVAFKSFPPTDLIGDIVNGRAYFTPAAFVLDSTLPLFADSARYALRLPEEQTPKRLEYICVAMLVDTVSIIRSSSWRIVGVFTTSGNNRQPSAIDVTVGATMQANITVDFKNLPPQPF